MTAFFKNFTPRVYQQTIFAKIRDKNALVVLPTGLGKTAIALLLAVATIHEKKGKIVFLAPTKPLVHQHLESFTEFLDSSFIHEDEMIVFTGSIKAEKRAELWKDGKIIFSTPQGLENDLLSKKISLTDVSLLIFDEAHRATGDYSYNWIASQYVKQRPNHHILALTASPGSEQEVLDEVCTNLHIEHIESRTRESPDVKPYVKDVDIQWEEVHLPLSFTEVLLDLKKLYNDKLQDIRLFTSTLNKNPKFLSKKDLLMIQAKLQSVISTGEADMTTYQGLSTCAQVIKIQHAIELLETQGVISAKKFLENIWKKGQKKETKAATTLSIDPLFKQILTKIWKLEDEGINHPKLPKLISMITEILSEKEDAKIIVFNNYRESIKTLYQHINKDTDLNSRNEKRIRPAMFVGQAKKSGLGLSQKEQISLIGDFKNGTYNVMIMSSVGEEGLDIPAVDVVIFYEPVPSAIRQIQRMGRTGRQEKGKVVVLIAKGTRDVAYRWSTLHKEKKMADIISQTKKNLPEEDITKKRNLENKAQKTIPGILTETENKSEPKIIADSREKYNKVIKELINEDILVGTKQLLSADYIIGEEIGIEFKTQKDFVDSLIDGRLLEQAANLSRNFQRPLFVIEGDADLYGLRNISPLAIKGAIASIASSFRIPILFTKDTKETAALFKMLLSKTNKAAYIPVHSSKPKSDEEMQEFIVSSLPFIGPNLAKELLQTFGSVEYIMTAEIEELASIKQIGEIKARKIKEILTKKYGSHSK